ncbi:Ethanolamine-phosphate cytidylyltransferase [Gurleya vavrai]
MKIFIDGCFDLFHYGHANALRQAKKFGKTLVCGINSTITTTKYKNTPIMTDSERFEVVKACRYVDEIVKDAPYYLDYELVKKLKCDLVVHGDDQILDKDGNNCYAPAKNENKFKEFERTYGISTSDIVGRMIYKEKKKKKVDGKLQIYHEKLIEEFKLPEFKREGKIVYVDGSFDLYHAGHTSIIEEAKKRGDFLVIGLHSDEEIFNVKGREPIMRYNERKLCIMSNKNVNQIIDNAPFHFKSDFITENGIDEIVCGTENLSLYEKIVDKVNVHGFYNDFRYLNCQMICNRIFNNFLEYEEKVLKYKNEL